MISLKIGAKEFYVSYFYGITVYKNTNEVNAVRLFDKTKFILDKDTSYHIKDNIFDEANWIPLLQWEKEKNDKN